MILRMKLLIIVAILSASTIAPSQVQTAPTAGDNSKSSATKPKVTPPKAIETPDPKPIKDHGTFTTVFTVTVGTDGLVHDPKMIKSSSNMQADANALEAVEKWKFKPATRDGVPVPVRIQIVVSPHIF